MDGDWAAELAELRALAREHLRWEQDLGSRGVPDLRADDGGEGVADHVAAGGFEGERATERGPVGGAPERSTRRSAPTEPRAHADRPAGARAVLEAAQRGTAQTAAPRPAPNADRFERRAAPAATAPAVADADRMRAEASDPPIRASASARPAIADREEPPQGRRVIDGTSRAGNDSEGRAEPARVESARAESARAESARAESARAESARDDSARAESARDDEPLARGGLSVDRAARGREETAARVDDRAARSEPTERDGEEVVGRADDRVGPIESFGGSPADRAARALAAAASPGARVERLTVVQDQVRGCTACRLHAGRTQTVFARGNPEARLVFVGEGPGYNEDQQGLPFVGAAGQLLDKMIAAMGLTLQEVYICNVVKCRPPENRTPNPDEAAACMPYLRAQLGIIAPHVIVALGRCAAENLGAAGPRWRGTWASWEGVPVMPTYHPAYLLRSPEHKRPVWQDLQAVLARMGRAVPSRG